jgi:hypothetical protein
MNFSNSNDTFLISLYIRSLMCNPEVLANTRKIYQKDHINIDVIAVQEVWSVPHHDIVNICKSKRNKRYDSTGLLSDK